MITVKAKGLADIGWIIGHRGEMEVNLPPGSSLYDLLMAMTEKLGDIFYQRIFEESKNLSPDVRLLINGRDIAFLNGLETKLDHNDHCSLIPPLAGG